MQNANSSGKPIVFYLVLILALLFSIVALAARIYFLPHSSSYLLFLSLGSLVFHSPFRLLFFSIFFVSPFLINVLVWSLEIGVFFFMLKTFFPFSSLNKPSPIQAVKHNYNKLPTYIIICTLLFITFFPLNELICFKHLIANQQDMEKVVTMVKTGELKPEIFPGEHKVVYFKLPAEFSHVSSRDIIKFDKVRQQVFFYFSNRNNDLFLDGFTAFVYSIDNKKPSRGDYAYSDQPNPSSIDVIMESKKLKNHWFWIDTMDFD